MSDSSKCSHSALSSDKRRIVEFLQQQVNDGGQYIRAHEIADSLGLSSKQVGAHLGHLKDRQDILSISKWAESRSTTWYIEANNS